jgi:hypothetical protein
MFMFLMPTLQHRCAPLAPYFPPGRKDFEMDRPKKAEYTDECFEQSRGLKRKIAKARDEASSSFN